MSIKVHDFKHVPGKNDAEYIKLLKEALERQQRITGLWKAIAKDYLKTDDVSEWMNEFMFDPDASAKISSVIHSYPICLKNVADIVQAIVPLLEIDDGYGVANTIRAFVQNKSR